MQQTITLKVKPSEADDETVLRSLIAQACGVNPERISGYNMVKKSMDARSRQIWLNLTVRVFVDEPFQAILPAALHWQDVHHARKMVVVIGAGPAGLFAALRLLELGIKP